MTQTMELEKRDTMMILTGKNAKSYNAAMRAVNAGLTDEDQLELDLLDDSLNETADWLREQRQQMKTGDGQ